MAGTASAHPVASKPDRPAVSCSGTGCNNKDPEATGCDSGATTVASTKTSYGELDLRWSAACQTNWVRITGYPGGTPLLEFEVLDATRDGNSNPIYYYAGTGAGTHWGNMVYSPAADCAEGLVAFHSSGDWDNGVGSSACPGVKFPSPFFMTDQAPSTGLRSRA